jgi:hypothetical protein
MSDAIIQQEKSAVNELLKESKIPLPSEDSIKFLTSKGCVFGEKFGKEGFIQIKVRLPNGWKIEKDQDDGRHLHLINEKGRKIAQMFYKKTLYDKRCTFNLFQ